MIIHLKEKNTLIGLYGIKREFITLLLYIDDKNEFKKQIDSSSDKLNTYI